MKLLNHVGDALLAKLVPGIDAKANCGQCRYAYRRCGCCHCPSGLAYYERFYTDSCGRLCARRCSENAQDVCDFFCC